MGKRELLIILGFLIIGGIVYQATMPEDDSSGTRRSWYDVVRQARGEMFGSRARQAIDRTVTAPVPEGAGLLDLGTIAGEVIVTGEDRADVEAAVRLSVLGEDDADAQRAAEGLRVELQEQGERVVLAASHPDKWRLGRNRGFEQLTVKVPRGLRVKLRARGNVSVSHTAGAALEVNRGSTVLKDIAGPVTGEYRDGSLEVSGAERVDVETRRVAVRLAQVAGEVRVDGVDGQLAAEQLPGPVVLDVSRMMVELGEVGGTLEVEGRDGRAQLGSIRGALTIDASRMAITAALIDPVAVEAEINDAPFELTLPEGGLTLDVETTDGGSVQGAEGLPAAARDGATQRLSAEVNGGGPTVRVHGTRATITLKRK